MKKKQVLALALAVTMAGSMSMTALAGQWKQQVTGYYQTGYVYENPDGAYAKNGWYWINGKCYYFNEDGILLTNTTTPDGCQVDENGAWIVDGVVQTKEEVKIEIPYNPEHPLAGKIDDWNLRLLNDTYSLNYVCSWNVQAMLTGQMDQYFAPPVGDYVKENGTHIYTTQEDYDATRAKENALYNWFCNWLNSFDFQNMSEMERAQEIKKVMASASYDNAYATSAGYNRNTYYTVLIDKKGVCGELTMTAISLAKALGLESSVTGFGDHAWYYIKADGYWYEGNNTYLDISNPLTEEQYRARR